MKRWCVAVLCLGLAWAGAAWSAEVEHKRGDFRFFVGDAPAFVVPHPVAQRWDPKAPGIDDAVWRYWLYDEQVDHRKGVDASYVDYVYEPRTATNLGDAGKYQIEFNPEYQTLVLHHVELRRDGKWQNRLVADKISLARRETDFEQDMADGRVTALIVLDDVRVGDVVRICYTITGSNPILAGHAMDSIATAWGNPLHDAHLRVLFDPGTEVRWTLRNGANAPVVRSSADAVEASVDVHGAPTVIDEGNYPVWYGPWPTVQVAPARTWGDVVAWALPLYPDAGPLPAELQARVAAWKKLPDAKARLRAALRTVQDDVRYFGVEMGSSTHRPAPPSETWARRYGDCKDKAYLLSTILHALDIQASPALISTRRGRALLDYVPSAAAFDHVVVRAVLDGKPTYVDPTMSQQGGEPSDVDLSGYGVGLPIQAGITALDPVAPPAQSASGVAIRERFSPESKGGLRYEIETTYTGSTADMVRRSLAGQRTDDVARRYADYYRKRYGALDIVSALAVQDDRDANTFRVREVYRLDNPYDAEGTTRALDLYALALDDATEPPRTLQRKGPLEIGQPARYRHDVEFTPPAGWRPTFTNQKQSVATDAYAFSLQVERGDVGPAGGAIRVHYALDVKAHELSADSANAHLAHLREVRDMLSSRLRFATPVERLGTKERDDRLRSLLQDVLKDQGKTE